MFLDRLEIPGDHYKVAALHRKGGNFGPEWRQLSSGTVAVLLRIMHTCRQLRADAVSIHDPPEKRGS